MHENIGFSLPKFHWALVTLFYHTLHTYTCTVCMLSFIKCDLPFFFFYHLSFYEMLLTEFPDVRCNKSLEVYGSLGSEFPSDFWELKAGIWEGTGHGIAFPCASSE